MKLNLGRIDVEIINDPGEVSNLLNFILLDETTKNIYGGLLSLFPDTDKATAVI